jgi:DNA-binding transcriptional LysR family regulator
VNANTPNSWVSIELRHLVALHTVAEERSFVRAAQRLGYTQSAVSNQIAALERLVSARLVERVRGGSSVSLTEAGKRLDEHAVVLMARLNAARQDVARVSPGARPTLRVGYFQSVGATALPRIARAFRRRFPDVALEFELGDAERPLQEKAATGALDLAFVSGPVRVASLASVQLFEDAFVLVGPPERELPVVPDFSLRPLLAFRPCHVQRHYEAALLHGAPPANRALWLEDATTIQALVEAGCAYALLPGLAVTNHALPLRVLDGPVREVLIVWQRDRPVTGRISSFVEAAEREFEAIRAEYDRWLVAEETAA